jgi:hypothetical protein
MNVESEYINPLTGKGWTDYEEQIIAKVRLEQGLSRIAAIQFARRIWLIGDTAPPMWPDERPKPNSTAPVAETKRRGGRPRKHLTSANRQRDYRDRLKTLRNSLVSA